MTTTEQFTLPQVGIGTYRLSPADAERSVTHALNAGYRLVDTANIYMNEKAVGRALAAADVPRADITLTTKLWPKDFAYEKARAAIDASLKRLHVDYVDLLLLHQPVGRVSDAWRALEDAQTEGKVRALGVSNFTQTDLEALLRSARVMPRVNQVECHPYFQQTELKAFMAEHDITLEAWYPLGSANRELLTEPIFARLAAKYGKSVPQIILRWHVQSGHVVIPGSKNLEHVSANLAILDFSLNEDEMGEIRMLDKGRELARIPRPLCRLIGMVGPNYESQE